MSQNENPNTSGPLPTFESFIASRKAEKAEKVEEGKAMEEATQPAVESAEGGAAATELGDAKQSVN